MHEELVIPDATDSCCIHMDLKSDNILLAADRYSVVGAQLISDFGISVIDRSTENQHTSAQGPGTAFHQVISRTKTMEACA